MTGLPLWNILVCAVLYAAATLPVIRMGHQGLFYDRLNGDYAATPITMVSKGLYHNRNRSYSPHLGRFVQSDPNATGVVTAFHGSRGRSPAVGVDSPELLTLLGDGFSLYQAYGSMPVVQTDPTGRFFGIAAFFAGHTIGGYVDAVDKLGDVALSYSLADQVTDMIDQYAVNQMFDVDWASDWSQGDDWYSGAAINSSSFDAYFEKQANAGSGGLVFAGPALSITRSATHGGAAHDLWSRAWADYLKIKFGNSRFDQAIVDINTGRTLTSMRPDAWAYDHKNQRYVIIEVTDSQSRAAALAKRKPYADALGVQPHELDFRVQPVGSGGPRGFGASLNRIRGLLPGRR